MVDDVGPTAHLVSDDAGPIVLAFRGVLDIAGVQAVRPEVDAVLARHVGPLTLDLGRVTFMDSSGIALLIEMANRVEDLCIVHLPDNLRRVLEITGLLGHLGVDDGRRRFDASLGAVAEARAWTADLVRDQPGRIRDAVALVVSELCTNALVHASSGFDLHVERSGGTLLVEVGDDGIGMPALQEATPVEPHGRGLRIVDELTTDWGVTTVGGSGKTVWARIDLDPVGADPA